MHWSANTPTSAMIPVLRKEQQDLMARRTTRSLYVVLAATAAGLDAFVDAHLADFDATGDRLGLSLAPGSAWLALRHRW